MGLISRVSSRTYRDENMIRWASSRFIFNSRTHRRALKLRPAEQKILEKSSKDQEISTPIRASLFGEVDDKTNKAQYNNLMDEMKKARRFNHHHVPAKKISERYDRSQTKKRVHPELTKTNVETQIYLYFPNRLHGAILRQFSEQITDHFNALSMHPATLGIQLEHLQAGSEFVHGSQKSRFLVNFLDEADASKFTRAVDGKQLTYWDKTSSEDQAYHCHWDYTDSRSQFCTRLRVYDVPRTATREDIRKAFPLATDAHFMGPNPSKAFLVFPTVKDKLHTYLKHVQITNVAVIKHRRVLVTPRGPERPSPENLGRMRDDMKNIQFDIKDKIGFPTEALEFGDTITIKLDPRAQKILEDDNIIPAKKLNKKRTGKTKLQQDTDSLFAMM